MCKCKSYNWKVKGAKHPNVIVDVPKKLRDGKKRVCLDKCMAKPIMSLWAAGLKTLNCCCGHSKRPPSIIIPEDADPKAYAKILTRYYSTFLIGKWCHDELQWWIAYGGLGAALGFPALSDKSVKVSS